MVQIFQYIMLVGIVLVALVAVYKMGKQEGKHQERMHLLDILRTLPMMTQLIVHSELKYDSRYYGLYIIDHILKKMREG